MPLERTARGHRFDFESRGCVVCGMTHRDFLNKGRPACMGIPPEKPEQSKIEDDKGPQLA
jgi:protein-arginine kinase activator protein McsA